jgi:hypothetical protein
MKKYFLIVCLIISSALLADEFSDLKKKKEEAVAKNPFASKKASCSTTASSGAKLTETWFFFADTYIQDISGLLLNKGTYQIGKDSLELKQNYSKMGMKIDSAIIEMSLKTKLSTKGFDYILTNTKGDKYLYECLWIGSSI